MAIDINTVLKQLAGQIGDTAKKNIGDAVAQLTEADIRIIQRASERKAELLLARLLGEDTTADEAQIDATLGFLASKAAAIARETFKKTALEVVQTAGKIALKLVFGAIVP